MAGQYIYLPGVTAAASAGAARIDMSSADVVAAKISSLQHVVSARSLVPVPTGGVSGGCRNTGLPLVPKGSGAANLALYEIAGRIGLGINGAGSAGLALPAGSLTGSFTKVLAISLDATDAAGTYVMNFLSGFDPDGVYISGLARAYGAASTVYPGKIGSNTGISGTWSWADQVPGSWAVLVVDYNNSSRVLSVSINQAGSFVTAVMPAAYAPKAGSYVEIGYHIDASSLRKSKVGDLYTFSDSLLKDEIGKSQLVALVAALKAQYGIAA